MLKIKDNVDLKEIVKKYNLDYEIIDGDYESCVPGDIEYFDKSEVFISENTKRIYGIDCSSLDLLYDLIKANLVEKVESDE